MEVIILAGGKGTRLRSLISDRPKPLAPVNGKAFLELIMEYFLLQGCQHFIVSVGYKRNMIIDHLGDKFHGVPVTFAEELNPLGTGGALLNAYSYLRSEQPFLVANGDTYFNINLKEFRKELIALNGDVNIALFKAPEVNRYGRVLLDEKRVVKFGFGEKAQLNDLANGGFFFLKRDALFGLEKRGPPLDLEKDIFPKLVAGGKKIVGTEFAATFFDIGVPNDYSKFCETQLN